MHKKLLSETFIVTGTVEKESFLKLKQIENHCLSNFTLGNRMTNDQFWHLDDYISVPYHQHIQWFQDYVRDHYREQYETTLMPTTNNSIRGIVQQSGEHINYHNHINPWDLEDSPEVSCLYCVSETPQKSHVIFKYDDGRNKHRLWKQQIQQNQFILFSSHLEHTITQNKNSGFLVNLSTHYQLL